MDKVIVIRYGELYLKGKNRIYFERILIKNIKTKLKEFDCEMIFGRSRYLIQNYKPENENSIIKALQTIFGIHSLSIAWHISSDYATILTAASELSPNSGKFRVNANRADKTYPLHSLELAAKLGEDLLHLKNNLTVDLHNPNFIVNVDVREDKTAYVYSQVIEGAGGMPVSSGGKGLILLSGGIDSPVSGYMMAKRGMNMDALHFHSYPYTSERAKQKVIELAKTMQNYCGHINLLSVSITKIQETIHAKCDDSYMITILRRCMMKIAERVAINRNCGCIINGESLGQVASQTLQSITVTNDVIKTMPVFRPLIGMDKQEIIAIAEKINTYEISIQPYEDCCTVFLPENPITRPTLEKSIKEESKIENLEELINEAVNNIEVISK